MLCLTPAFREKYPIPATLMSIMHRAQEGTQQDNLTFSVQSQSLGGEAGLIQMI